MLLAALRFRHDAMPPPTPDAATATRVPRQDDARLIPPEL